MCRSVAVLLLLLLLLLPFVRLSIFILFDLISGEFYAARCSPFIRSPCPARCVHCRFCNGRTLPVPFAHSALRQSSAQGSEPPLLIFILVLIFPHTAHTHTHASSCGGPKMIEAPRPLRLIFFYCTVSGTFCYTWERFVSLLNKHDIFTDSSTERLLFHSFT